MRVSAVKIHKTKKGREYINFRGKRIHLDLFKWGSPFVEQGRMWDAYHDITLSDVLLIRVAEPGKIAVIGYQF